VLQYSTFFSYVVIFRCWSGEKVTKNDSPTASPHIYAPLPSQNVAGKVYRRDGRIQDEKEFLHQAEVLKELGTHDSVVQLVDVLREHVAVPCIFLELAPRSDLQSYLSTDTGRETSLSKLVNWATQVE